MKISVVINTLNEEQNLPRAIKSAKNLAHEIVVVDMHSQDKTPSIARQMGAKVFNHQPTGYVEPARNFAISKASGNWILILDADEELTPTLCRVLKQLVRGEPSRDLDPPSSLTYIRIPRKNIIFGEWVRHARWWPDYNIRFFKKGCVQWSDEIHLPPQTKGQGWDLPPQEEYALIHHHYQSKN